MKNLCVLPCAAVCCALSFSCERVAMCTKCTQVLLSRPPLGTSCRLEIRCVDSFSARAGGGSRKKICGVNGGRGVVFITYMMTRVLYKYPKPAQFVAMAISANVCWNCESNIL